MISEEKTKGGAELERRGAATHAPPAPPAHAGSTSTRTTPAETPDTRAVTRPAPKRRERLSHERRVLLMALAAALPAVIVSLVLLWAGPYTPKTVWTLAALIICVWLGFSFAAQGRVMRPLQTVSNLLASLREGDYSFRARGGRGDDALGEVIREINALGETLREQRLGALEATALLRAVMAEIDVAVFAFDPAGRLRLVNRAGERLLARHAERLLSRTAEELGLSDCLKFEDDGAQHTLQKAFPGAGNVFKPWGVRRSSFREGGLPHHLLVLSDLSGPLREEERKAWQRLVRVLGHELNNSLAPIKSIAGSLANLLARTPRPDDWQEDMERGLTVVSSRAESLSRFMESYARLARLPPPRRAPVSVGALVRRVAGLETRLNVEVIGGEELSIEADSDQLEQLLINLVRNATDAALVTGGAVRVGWRLSEGHVEIRVEDEGLGIANPANLFVPFFTTKPGGSGIGLVLCRQIAEAHGGTLTLENRKSGAGCEARLRLPA
ncbi:MAG TPA: ATP-binding protein [Pyrinomonadaceae bacterium]|nr:ATP-binding protein [Pyrinomonadaceae bacterium]